MSTVFYCTFQNIKIAWFGPLSMVRATDIILNQINQFAHFNRNMSNFRKYEHISLNVYIIH